MLRLKSLVVLLTCLTIFAALGCSQANSDTSQQGGDAVNPQYVKLDFLKNPDKIYVHTEEVLEELKNMIKKQSKLEQQGKKKEIAELNQQVRETITKNVITDGEVIEALLNHIKELKAEKVEINEENMQSVRSKELFRLQLFYAKSPSAWELLRVLENNYIIVDVTGKSRTDNPYFAKAKVSQDLFQELNRIADSFE